MSLKKIVLSLAVVIATSVLASASAFAHHSFAMFDMEKTLTYVGVVVDYKWENPHTHIILKVAPGAQDSATVGTWDVEGGSVNIMGRQGWNRGSYKPGDTITVVGHPMKDGTKGASLFYAIRPDGTRLYHDIARPKDDAAAKAGN
jgi:Family of unknown function (DUF6152)